MLAFNQGNYREQFEASTESVNIVDENPGEEILEQDLESIDEATTVKATAIDKGTPTPNIPSRLSSRQLEEFKELMVSRREVLNKRCQARKKRTAGRVFNNLIVSLNMNVPYFNAFDVKQRFN